MPALPNARLTVGGGVTLSPLTLDDAAVLHESVADAELRRWLPLPRPYTLDTARTWCTTANQELRTSGKALILAVRVDGRFAGSIDVKRIDWRGMTAELTYWMAASQRGRGIMPAVVTELAAWLLRRQQFQRVELRIAPGNHASIRVAEKAEFRYEGTARNAGFTNDGRVDLRIYALIPADLHPTS